MSKKKKQTQAASEQSHGFKDSALGRIPEGWAVRAIGEVTEVNPEKLSAKTKKNFIIRYLDIESIPAPGFIASYKTFHFFEAPSRAQRLVKKDDVIISTVRPYLKSFAYITKQYDNFVCSTGFAVLRVRQGFNSKFLFQYILTDHFLSQVLPKMVGSNYPAVNSSDIAAILLPIPPLPEQSAIAAILSTADDAIEKTDLLIAKYKRIKQGLMQDLFRYGIDENGQIRREQTHRFKDSPLGKIPDEWEVKGLLGICNLVNGRAFKPSEWSDSGLSIVRIENLNNILASFNYCNFKVPSKYYVNDGDLLISWSGTPGTSFGIFVWNRGRAILNQHIFKVILPPDSIISEYFYYAYKNLLIEMIKNSHGGVGLQHITKSDLQQLNLLLPTLSEQSRIATVLSAADAVIEKEESYRQKLLALKHGLMEDLLTGKVRVLEIANK